MWWDHVKSLNFPREPKEAHARVPTGSRATCRIRPDRFIEALELQPAVDKVESATSIAPPFGASVGSARREEHRRFRVQSCGGLSRFIHDENLLLGAGAEAVEIAKERVADLTANKRATANGRWLYGGTRRGKTVLTDGPTRSMRYLCAFTGQSSCPDSLCTQ